jgi:hypothetical protein
MMLHLREVHNRYQSKHVPRYDLYVGMARRMLDRRKEGGESRKEKGKKEEGRRKEEGGRKKEEGGRRKEEGGGRREGK